MRISNGNVLVIFGIMHALLGISPWAFGEQFSGFAQQLFFRVSEGLLEFPLLGGQMNYGNFAAFWFFYFGVLLIPLGILLSYVEQQWGGVPRKFALSYLLFVLLGAYMIPLSGMTMLMLPHALYMHYRAGFSTIFS